MLRAVASAALIHFQFYARCRSSPRWSAWAEPAESTPEALGEDKALMTCNGGAGGFNEHQEAEVRQAASRRVEERARGDAWSRRPRGSPGGRRGRGARRGGRQLRIAGWDCFFFQDNFLVRPMGEQYDLDAPEWNESKASRSRQGAPGNFANHFRLTQFHFLSVPCISIKAAFAPETESTELVSKSPDEDHEASSNSARIWSCSSTVPLSPSQSKVPSLE